VKSTYFVRDNYFSQEDWTMMWRKSLKADYVPIVDIRAVKSYKKEKGETDLRGAILETEKYPIKPVEVIGETEEEKLQITADLMEGFYRKRQILFGGYLKRFVKNRTA
jgi:plasmid rolling circle replication initiator protein Rep